MTCTIRISGPPHRRSIVLYAEDGCTRLISRKVAPGVSDREAHEAFTARLMGHPAFRDVVATSWDDEVLAGVDGL